MMKLMLPWPPTANTHWRNVNGRTLLSKKGREYRAEVMIRCANKGRIEKRCRVDIEAFPPDKRKRDVDNILKPVLDALQSAGVLADDNLVRELRTVFHDDQAKKPGWLWVNIEEFCST